MAGDPDPDDKAAWGSCLWNGYVETGATREERARRLAEVPRPWRDSVRRHVEMVFALAARARRRRMARECW